MAHHTTFGDAAGSSVVAVNTSRSKLGGAHPPGLGVGDLATWPSAQHTTLPLSDGSGNAAIGVAWKAVPARRHACINTSAKSAVVEAAAPLIATGSEVSIEDTPHHAPTRT